MWNTQQRKCQLSNSLFLICFEVNFKFFIDSMSWLENGTTASNQIW